MTSKNPFATPSPSPDSNPNPTDWLARLLPNAKATFVRWERWRLVYCGICLAATIAFMFMFQNIPRRLFPDLGANQPLDSWLAYAIAGVISNFCFFAGPVVDTYANWLGLKSRWFGIGLLGLGTSFTVFAAFLAVSGFFN